MNAFQGEHHARQRGAERRRQTSCRTSGHHIMLLHVLTTLATQPMRQELRARRADLNRRPLTAQRQTKRGTQQATDKTDRQNRLPPHPQPGKYHAVCLRNATARRHRLPADHPGDQQADHQRSKRPRNNQPRIHANLRIHPTREPRAVLDAETVQNHQKTGHQTHAYTSHGDLPLHTIEQRNHPLNMLRHAHIILPCHRLPASLWLLCILRCPIARLPGCLVDRFGRNGQPRAEDPLMDDRFRRIGHTQSLIPTIHGIFGRIGH